ncbi:MAG: nucleotidyltransferase family protein [Coriobacteriia bacterium]|nr:nucleotidyltransferase family protein [Coriobacteriia bacterium]
MSLPSEYPIPSPGPEVDPLRNSQESGQVDAVILAGGSAEALDAQCVAKGLFPVAGRPLVAWVAAALRNAQSIRKIVAVVPTDEDLGDWTDLVDGVVVHDASFSENLGAGIGALPKDLQLVGVTGDIPALTPEAIDDLVAQTLARKVAVCYPLISEGDMLEQFPGSARTFFKLKSGRYTGGNAMLGDPRLFAPLHDLTQQMFETRKSPVKMLQLIGPAFAAKLLAGRLEPVDVEKRLSKIMNASCAAIYTRYASIGADVDKPADIAPVEHFLAHAHETAHESGTGAASKTETGTGTES